MKKGRGGGGGAGGGRGERLRCLDALRGFDMFWIIGGAEVVRALAERVPWRWLDWFAGQLHHAEWHGFTAWDLVFPLFLFIAGAAMPYSLGRRKESGASAKSLTWKVVRRGLLLVLLGMVYNGLLQFDWERMRYPSVLGRIGLAYLFAGLIFLRTKASTRFLWAAGCLVVYWLALCFVPVPGHGMGDLSLGGNLAGWIDRSLLPGRLHRGVADPEGLLGTIPAVATALFGSLAGQLLREGKGGPHEKAATLFGMGVLSLLVGYVWALWFPLNKNLWTSSFALVAAGHSLWLLAVFYLLVDVWKLAPLFFPFVVIGLNPLLIYLVQDKVVDFERIAQFFLGGALGLAGDWQPLLAALAVLAVKWLLLWFLERRRLFLRV